MLLRLPLPDFPEAAQVSVLAWHAAPGDALAAGATLVDLLVDLGAGIDQDCPPTSVARIVLREPAWPVALLAVPGEPLLPDAAIALLADAAGAPPGVSPDTPAARDVRVTVAAVLHHAGWWGG